ncbi:HHR010Wp [Eremothecium sinecaudum]|uniref:HHR010Wp n=1 Tax=Eremothecium sinecaudum TaxID=45286 RepID=A0A0X8HWL0_9SACH|nr:HHR010Wp [Eremothecium sinecaudum]AMD22779.1 HHR010Wp [Eremothecium sinecaudum]
MIRSPVKQKREDKSLDPGCLRLNPNSSRLRIDEVLKALKVNNANPSSPQANTLTMVNLVFKNCDEQQLINLLIVKRSFWSNFYSLMNKYAYSNSLLCSALSVLRITENLLLEAKGSKLLEALSAFSIGMHGNYDILTVLAGELMAAEEPSQSKNDIISILGNYIACLNKFAKLSPDDAAPVVAEVYTALKKGRILAAVAYYLDESTEARSRDAIIHMFFSPFKSMLTFMSSTKVSTNTTHLAKQLERSIEKIFYLNKSVKELFLKINNEFKDPSCFSILEIIDLNAILKDDNLSLKKKITEQLMFEEQPFPLFSGSIGITKVVFEYCTSKYNGAKTPNYIFQILLNREAVTFALVNRLLSFWIESHAKASTDLESLLQLVNTLFDKVDKEINKGGQESPVLDRTLELINSFSYEKLRKFQVQLLKGKQHQRWNKQGAQFNNVLSKQVEEYVKQQRVFQLQIGIWVYADDPVAAYRTKNPKFFYLVLSDNHYNLLAREFKYRIERTPTVEQNKIISPDGDAVLGLSTIVIPLKRIIDYRSRELVGKNITQPHKRLINMSRNASYTEVQLVGKNEKLLLTFYLDNKEASYIWFDGLQLIASQRQNKVSKPTKNQIETLIDIRKNIQMVGLSHYNFLEGFDEYTDDDDEYYDLDALSILTEDFFYD